MLFSLQTLNLLLQCTVSYFLSYIVIVQVITTSVYGIISLKTVFVNVRVWNNQEWLGLVWLLKKSVRKTSRELAIPVTYGEFKGNTYQLKSLLFLIVRSSKACRPRFNPRCVSSTSTFYVYESLCNIAYIVVYHI